LQTGWSQYDNWLDAGALVQDRNREILPVPKF
jgi:hypothetical protein